MNFKQIVNSLLTYKPTNDYQFDITNNSNNIEAIKNASISTTDNNKPINNTSNYSFSNKTQNNTQQTNSLQQSENATNRQNIYPDLQSNLTLIKTTYNTLINSDIVIRNFTLNARNKQFDAFLLYVDGLVDTNLMNDFVFKPLMLRNTSNLYDKSQNKITNKKNNTANNSNTNNTNTKNVTNNKSNKNKKTYTRIKQFNLVDYLQKSLMPENSVNILDDFSKVFNAVNSGNCVLFIDTISKAFDIEVKGFKQRAINSPTNEVVIKGSQEAFVENIRTNTSIIRRIINNENLIIENIEVGKITKTKCGICYMKNITNSDLIAEVKYRINNLSIDSIVSSR